VPKKTDSLDQEKVIFGRIDQITSWAASYKDPDFSSNVIPLQDLARSIDHTLLKPEATVKDVERICREAKENHFATVCVNSCFIKEATHFLSGSTVLPIAVIGFPLGAMTTNAKVFETKEAVALGAQEIDMVLSIGRLKNKEYDLVNSDIAAVVEAAKPYPVKVILETGLLTLEEKIVGCLLAQNAGAAFVKTSTGFSGTGATTPDIALMRYIVGKTMGVKASGGIRTTDDAQKMIQAGANRIGASASVQIVSGTKTAPPPGTY